MYQVARLTQDERDALFTNTANKLGINTAIIEKDYWVCLTLDYLFHTSPWKDAFVFKGGTSLSKAYSLIERFSEDIDLILDWRTLGFSHNEPWEIKSNTQLEKFCDNANQKTVRFLSNSFLPPFAAAMSEILGTPSDVRINAQDPQIVDFYYPCGSHSQALLPAIRLEIGALAAWTPVRDVSIQSHAAQAYHHLFHQAESIIRTVSPERTFWEKVTILHQEGHRPEKNPLPLRYSRHYYDLYKMAQNTEVKTSALSDLALLKRVVDFKIRFYPRKWAMYEEAMPGTFKITIPEYNSSALRHDYEQMSEMIYGQRPSFETLMQGISQLENELNQL